MKNVHVLTREEQTALNGGIYGGVVMSEDGRSCTDPRDFRKIGTTGPYDPSPPIGNQ